MKRGGAKAVASCFGAMVIAGVWLGFGPRALGGSLDYVTVAGGSSMEPLFRVGDLAVTHPAPSYAVGDVIATRTDYGTIVLHRIVGRDGDRYVTKGDNNDFRDAYHPRAADVIGALWFRIPFVGKAFTAARSPRGLVLGGGGLAAGMLVAGGGAVRRRRRRTDGRVRRARSPADSRGGSGGATPAEQIVGGALLALVLFAALGIVAFGRPVRAAATHGYDQRGTFRYTATATRGVYGTRTVETGQPVFLRLTNRVTMAFEYALSTAGEHTVGGESRLRVELSAANGWHRAIPLTPATPFFGDRFAASAALDLPALRDVIARTERDTGVVNQIYNLAVIADVHARGDVRGHGFDSTFMPAVHFLLDPLQLQLHEEGTEPGMPVVTVAHGRVRVPGGADARMKMLRIALPVRVARTASTAGAAAASVVALIAAILAAHAARADEPTRIKARYGALLIPIEGMPPRSYVDVGSFEALRKLAERYEREILHVNDDDVHTYIVEDGQTAYRTVAREARVAPAAPLTVVADLRTVRFAREGRGDA